jgi:endonuclease/exonuclease/phosphatase (EEP) superfamily protein YafD
VGNSFGIVCWNVYKKNRTDKTFASFLKRRFGSSVDFLLLQEAGFADTHPCRLEGFMFDAAANLEMRHGYYGVLTAGRVAALEAKAFLSQEREGIWGTHKSLLLSQYVFGDGTPLLLVNVHAINFRENRAYRSEKERLFSFLSDYEGALVVAGDFNAWNRTRQGKLFEMANRLNMKRVPVEKQVKSFLGYPLDFVFYRGVTLLEYAVDDTHGISDHHPVYVRFCKEIQSDACLPSLISS